jgi:putative DNA primase/helicase
MAGVRRPVSGRALDLSAGLTDTGNAERFATQHEAHVKYCFEWDSWVVFDGRRWARDRDGQVFRLAKRTVRRILAEASKIDDDKVRKALAKHAQRSESAKAIKAMLELARSDERVAIVPEKFDAPSTHYLLNVLNGTLELRTFTLLPHRPEDFITRLAPVEYNPGARSELWEQVITRALPDDLVRAFAQRFFGSCLTADARDERVIIAHGTGANSKTTIQNGVRGTLGDYAHQASFETFLEATGRADRRGAPRSDLMALRGARFISASEPGEGRRLNENMIKLFTGGEGTTARGLYERHQTTFPTEGKLLLLANHRPEVRGMDEAVWRRMLELPFTVTIPENERDATLKDRLAEPREQSGILCWLLDGCRDWQSTTIDRLRPPESVIVATHVYRQSQDRVGPFLADRCSFGNHLWVSSRDLKSGYEAWCQCSGEEALPFTRITARLRDLSCKPAPNPDTTDRSRTRGWLGVAIKSGAAADPPSADGADSEYTDFPLAPSHEGDSMESVSAPSACPQTELGPLGPDFDCGTTCP